ncbi:sensor histidine kinase [Treponema sp. Marseille-Q4523]|uniref:sensor histidine kinase n=1 Tax=Treponema sp. Marseille-Q4523 TaxID=2810610 RepID=UPI00196021B4|nr:sensor histidine kinase [Treponema sp. Marseille-Q4523]MBM7021972.1 sensor histidine kinase [Treponema sp. Marseille-Q4523]
MIEHGLKTTRAVKYEKNSFHDAMLRIVAVSSLLPLFSAVIAFCIFAYIYFNAGILAENKNDSEAASRELRMIFQTYAQELNSPAFDFEAKLPRDKNGNTFLTLEIQFMNRQGHSADFYLFDDASRLLFSSTSMPLSFMPPDVGRNWGLYKRMEERPGTVQCTFFRGNLLIGKKLAEGCAVFVIPSFYFTNHTLEHVSNIVVANRYGEIALSSTAMFTGNFNRIDPQAAKAASFFSFKNNRYFKTERRIRLADEALIVYAFSAVKRSFAMLVLGGSILLCIIALSGVITYAAVARSVTKRTESIDKITTCFDEVQKGNLTKRMTLEENDEFAVIADSYNTMIRSIDELLRKNKEINEETTRAQIKQLESQFNPHFLSNTLQVIKYMVALEPDAVPAIIDHLSKLLRYSINASEARCTLAEDLEYTKNYIAIQRFRFTDTLDCILDIAQEAQNCIVPKLLIQPLIENAIQYGFAAEKRKLLIIIRARIEGENIVITVTDDGCGMDEKKVSELHEMLSERTRTTNHFGLYNIAKRIRLLYGEKSDMIIKSGLHRGTSITISFPAVF